MRLILKLPGKESRLRILVAIGLMTNCSFHLVELLLGSIDVHRTHSELVGVKLCTYSSDTLNEIVISSLNKELPHNHINDNRFPEYPKCKRSYQRFEEK